MGVADHREAAKAPVAVRVLVVSSTRTEKTDASGAWIANALAEHGHEVLSVEIVDDDVERIEAEVRGYATDGRTRAAIVTGGTGMSLRDVTPEALYPLFNRDIPGFGELFRMLSFQEIGAASMLSRAFAGVSGGLVVFALPGSLNACKLAIDKLILPELSHLCHQVVKEGTEPVPPPLDEGFDDLGAVGMDNLDPDLGDDFDDNYPIHDEDTFEGTADEDDREDFVVDEGAVRGIGLEASQPNQSVRPASEQGPWQRWIANQGGLVTRHKRYELPEVLDNIPPFVQVLHTAGQQAVLQLPNGRKYSLWGFPDLDRPSSKVLAVGWGAPYGEVVALHRYPTMTATSMEGSTGQAPSRSSDVGSICEAVTGSKPRDCDGTLFAVAGDAVWFEQGGSVKRWDGRKLSDEGFPKQVLARLALNWSNR
ncbi:MAG: molybdenum cofactor biosynthesis protein MoaB [Deltaproteobacteria bacterium]|nr:MAG: molybdenum cofactor biosynthesis protein MoaB [Deltaproteobacteria bacterium]